jgi:hypothetical protein
MTYGDTPKNIDGILSRLEDKATIDGQTAIALKFSKLKGTTFYNFPHKLNKLMSLVKEYQLVLVDGDVQDLIDSIDEIQWFNNFKKLNQINKLIKVIEAL